MLLHLSIKANKLKNKANKTLTATNTKKSSQLWQTNHTNPSKLLVFLRFVEGRASLDFRRFTGLGKIVIWPASCAWRLANGIILYVSLWLSVFSATAAWSRLNSPTYAEHSEIHETYTPPIYKKALSIKPFIFHMEMLL